MIYHKTFLGGDDRTLVNPRLEIYYNIMNIKTNILSYIIWFINIIIYQ